MTEDYITNVSLCYTVMAYIDLSCTFEVWWIIKNFMTGFAVSTSLCVSLSLSHTHSFCFCFSCFSLPRLQAGVSSLQGGVFIRGICQEATLPPLLPQWMYSALAGAGKDEGWKRPVGWRVWRSARFVMKVFTVCHTSWIEGCDDNTETFLLLYCYTTLDFFSPADWYGFFFLHFSQHDTCPVCRKSLDGVDNSLPPTSEPPEARSIRTEQQEKQAIWETWPSNSTSFTVFESVSPQSCFLNKIHYMHHSHKFAASRLTWFTRLC